MLKHLTIKNYALIKHLEMNPADGLSVITGETGAGKSIMLGALGLLMGNRADTRVLWNEQEKCITEGTFEIGNYSLEPLFQRHDLDYEAVTVIRREISAGGKSRAFINDTPVTLDVLKEIGCSLMDIHSQHETLQLSNHRFQLSLLDAYAGNKNLLDNYTALWQQMNGARKSYENLQQEAEILRQESDFIHFQLDELQKAALQEGELIQLESELNVMEHAEDIKSRFNAILELLTRSEFASQNSLTEVRNQLQPVAGFSPAYQALLSRIESIRIELNDIIQELEREEESIEFEPERATVVRDRVDLIYRLLKKHHANSILELLQLQEALQQKAQLTANLDEALAAAKHAYEVSRQEVIKAADQLSKARQKITTPLIKQLTDLLKELGIPDARLEIEQQTIEPTETGTDRIEIVFSANKGIAPKPLALVASGGEFSRLMFCIKYVMAEKTSMPTLVLDEIDTGISGEIAIQMGKLMKQMAKEHQLICITHLPQIAAKGDTHYFVYKDNSSQKTVSEIKLLSEKERVEEIAKMIGGAKPSKIAYESAKELFG